MSATASVTYREATLQDVEAVREIARETWEHDYPSVVNREAITDTVETWYDHDQLAADVRRGDALVLVAQVTTTDGTPSDDRDESGDEDRNTDGDGGDGGDDGAGIEIAGFVHGVIDGDRGSLLRAYVQPSSRGEGFGRGLVQAALDSFRDRGCERAEAMVLARNDPGNDFYRALGFEKVATDTTTIGDEGYDEHVYLRYL